MNEVIDEADCIAYQSVARDAHIDRESHYLLLVYYKVLLKTWWVFVIVIGYILHRH